MNRFIKFSAILVTICTSIFLMYSISNSLKTTKIKISKINLPEVRLAFSNSDNEDLKPKILKKKISKIKIKKQQIKFKMIEKKALIERVVYTKNSDLEQNRLNVKNKSIHQLSISDIEIFEDRKINAIEEIKIANLMSNISKEFAALENIKENTEYLLAKELPKNEKDIPKEVIKSVVKENNIEEKKNLEITNSLKNEDHIEESFKKDEIKTVLSANEKEDEMIFFDYSESSDKKTENKIVEEKIIKETEKTSLITNQINKNKVLPNIPKKVIPVKAEIIKPENLIAYNSSAQTNNKENEYSKNDYSNSNKASTNNRKVGNSTLEINIERIVINKNVREKIKNFEITYLDNYKAIDRDFGTGSIKINKKINDVSIREALIKDYSMENYNTRTELVFEKDKIAVNIPVINKDSIYKIFNNREYFDSHVLVELDKDTEDVEIDGGKGKNYFQKKYLDENLNVVNQKDSEYSYVIFLGVVPGNRVLSYKLVDGKSTSKIFFIDEDEVYFDSNFYVFEKKDNFEIWKKDILGATEYQSDLLSNDVEFMLDGQNAKKETLYKYSFNGILYPLSSRKYYVINTEKDKIFVGKRSADKVVIPSEQFISEIISRFNMDSLKGQCIVQLNFSKAVKKITYDGLIHKYNISLESYYIDKNGQGFDTIDVETKQAFLKGEVADKNGVISINIEYFDGSVEYLKTFCSEDTYLVEQL